MSKSYIDLKTRQFALEIDMKPISTWARKGESIPLESSNRLHNLPLVAPTILQSCLGVYREDLDKTDDPVGSECVKLHVFSIESLLKKLNRKSRAYIECSQYPSAD